MDKALITMIENLHKNTDKTLDQWIAIVRKENFEKHGEIMKFLKEKHSFTHGFANLVAIKSREADSGASDENALVDSHYKGKEHFRPVYDKLVAEVMKFGNDVELAPKKTYVSLRRKKQFGMLQPATKTRFEVGINLKNQEPKGKLELVTSANSMCSHKINLESVKDIDKEVIQWLKLAYDNAG